MSPRRKVEDLISAGGVVCTTEGHGIQVLLCGRHSPPLWALPKGTPDPGETHEQTALREVEEETGLKVVIQAELGATEYWFVRTQENIRCHKTVYFYLMSPVGGSLSLHDPEFDVVQWFAETEALKAMTYAGEAAIVQRALSMLKAEAA